MMGKARDSVLFGWAVFLTAVVGLVAFVLIVIKEKSQKGVQTGKQTGSFLADKRRAISFYGVFSRVYDAVNGFFYTDAMRNNVAELANVRQDSRVLDVGCGTGYTTEAVLKKASLGEVNGIDLTPQQLRKAAVKLKPQKAIINLSRGDTENLPFRDETFDAVVSVGAVEYFPHPERALQEMARVVKHGGKVVVGGPEFEWFRRMSLDKTFYTPSATEVKEFFRQAKLKDIKGILTGVNTYFDTDKYVVLVVGTK